MNIDSEILVVIPYLASGAQGDELSLAVAGWRAFFTTPHHIVIVGDHHAVADTGDDITFLPCPRIAPVEGQYLPHLDMVNKFLKVMDAFPDHHGFVYSCDDIYATAPFDIWDVIRPKHPWRGFSFEPVEWRGKKPSWYTDKGKTGDLCDAIGIPRRNWVCHLPVYYERDLLLDVYERFGCTRKSYIVENIYFNLEYPLDVHAIDEKTVHDEVTEAVPDIRRLGSVTWVSNANSGWSKRLESMLQSFYINHGLKRLKHTKP